MKNESIGTEQTQPNKEFAVCALYKFTALPDFESLRDPILQQLLKHDIRGTLLLAAEGINGTISGTQKSLALFFSWLKEDSRFDPLETKISWHSKAPFHRTKVKLKQEIVTMGVKGIDPNTLVGTYVQPLDWNALIADPETLLIDTRNDYEVEIGTFAGAINPDTKTFREFPDYVSQQLDPAKHKQVAMFCTGGIRCEKASAYMKQQGFENVFHLQGGILKYLEEVAPSESLWEGECFVFDDRVAVNHQLEKGRFDQCHACRYPITDEDKQRAEYIPGVSCHRCHDSLSADQKARFSEREKQIRLAESRGEKHIGIESKDAAQRHRQSKMEFKQKQPGGNKSMPS